jgi:hypothetical protein
MDSGRAESLQLALTRLYSLLPERQKTEFSQSIR